MAMTPSAPGRGAARAMLIERRGRDFEAIGSFEIPAASLPPHIERPRGARVPDFFYEVEGPGGSYRAALPDPAATLVEVPVQIDGRWTMRAAQPVPPSSPRAATYEPMHFYLAYPAAIESGEVRLTSREYNDFCGNDPLFQKKFNFRNLPPLIRPRKEPHLLRLNTLIGNPPTVTVCLVGDGYLAGQKAEFDSDCKVLASHFAQELPELLAACNIVFKCIFEASSETGADYADGCHGKAETWRDTLYESNYGFSSYGAGFTPCFLLGGNPDIPGQHRVDHGAIAFICLVNATDYGGSGVPGMAWYAAKHPDALNVALHEFGHAMGLRDEYEGTSATGAPGPNVTANPLQLPWQTNNPQIFARSGCANPAGWPLPTAADAGKIAAFQGANRATCTWFRPALDCKMRHLDAPFCTVCRKAIVARALQPAGVP